MGQSLHVKYSHLVFSTKKREPMIHAELEPKLYDYLGGIVRASGAHLLEIGGMPDHVHLIIRDSKSVNDVQLIKDLKGGSSRWLNETFNFSNKFAWQSGYGWFSVGMRDVDQACAYVRGQKHHHQQESFQDEFRKFLRQYQIAYNEQYVWE